MNTILIIIGVISLVSVLYIWPLVVCLRNADQLLKLRTNPVIDIFKKNGQVTQEELDHIYTGWHSEVFYGFIPVVNIVFALFGKAYLAH
jgi:hypothetical protein